MFCSQCGAAATPGVGFCTRCGATYAAPASSAVAASAPLTAPVPRGKVVAPWKVVVFPLLTLGVYTYWMWWRTSREADEHLGARSHGLTRVGIGIAIAALLVSVWTAVRAILPYMAQVVADPTIQVDREQMVLDYTSDPAFLAAQGVVALGLLIMYAGLWRAWAALRADELRRGRAHALDPRVFAGILGAAAILTPASLLFPVLGIASFGAAVAGFWVFYDWQARLNDTWKAPPTDPAAPPPGAW